MSDLGWIVLGSVVMSVIALTGSVTALLPPGTLERMLLPIVAAAAGSLLGGAFFHMIPTGGAALSPFGSAGWVVAGFTTFLGLEQFLRWHHCRYSPAEHLAPAGLLILLGDGLHNFIGGLGVASAFLLDPKIGLTAWLAAAAHEIPQELGDFGVLVHGGWSRRRALTWNFVSGLTFLVGALLAYAASLRFDVAALVLFGAGNFIYIAASDLVPEIRSQSSLRRAFVHFACFTGGVALMVLLAIAFGHEGAA